VGILGIIFVALPLLAVGVVLLVGSTVAGQLDPEAEGRVPGEVTLDAGEERYVVALGSSPGTGTRSERRVFADEANQVRCTVTHPDGSTSELRGDRQGTSIETTGNYQTIGEFDGQGGDTTVACAFTSETDALGSVNDAPLIVHNKDEQLQYAGFGLIGASVVVILGSVALILWGARRPPT